MTTDVPTTIIIQIGQPSDLDRRMWGDRAEEKHALKVKRTVEDALRNAGCRGTATVYRNVRDGQVTVRAVTSTEESLLTVDRATAQAVVATMKSPRDLYRHHDDSFVHIGDLADAIQGNAEPVKEYQ